jgi:predicted O-methyltransferase YrrM
MHQLKNFIRHFFSATRKGHNVHSPFVYQLCEEVFYNRAAFYDFEKLDKLRKILRRDDTILQIEDFGAGSKTFKGSSRKVGHIAARGISSKKQSEILYKLVNFLKANTVIELGTSLGLNTLYFAKANQAGKVYSIEGSRALYDFSSRLLADNEAHNVTLINDRFDNSLPFLLQQINPVDLLYVDGNHTYEATMHYFNLALQKKGNDSVFVFDDIYWSEGMTKAWEAIKSNSEVTLSIDAFYFGIIFFKKEVKEKVNIKIWL